MVPDEPTSSAYFCAMVGNEESPIRTLPFKFLPLKKKEIDEHWLEKNHRVCQSLWPELNYAKIEERGELLTRLLKFYAECVATVTKCFTAEMQAAAEEEGLVQAGTGAQIKDVDTILNACLQWGNNENLTDEWLAKNVRIFKGVLKDPKWVESAVKEIESQYSFRFVRIGKETQNFIYDLVHAKWNDTLNQRFRRYMRAKKGAVWYEKKISQPPTVPGKNPFWSERVINGISGYLLTYLDVKAADLIPEDFSHPIAKGLSSGLTVDEITAIFKTQLDKEISLTSQKKRVKENSSLV